MRGLYQKMFDQIHLSENRTWSIRSELVSEGSRIKMEEKTMKKQNFLCRPVGVLAAALAVCALTVTAFAYGERIVENVYTFVTSARKKGVSCSCCCIYSITAAVSVVPLG